MTPVTALLAEADRLLDEQPRESDELILDDMLVALDPDSRVVRLFEPGGNRTPGQLKARIDRHLEASAPAAFPDDSQALYEALSELRRSLN